MKNNANKNSRNAIRVTSRSLSLLPAAALLIAITVFAISCSKKDDANPTLDLSILSISPNTGSVGTVVTITGTGFSATSSENTVTLNGKACPVTSAAVTQLRITIPADGGTGTINVTVGSKTVQSTTFTYLDPLSITSIEPTSGPKGTSVVIVGVGFSATPSSNMVTLNGIAAEVTAATTTQLTITIPGGAADGPIVVGVGGATVQSSDFDYVETLGVHTLVGDASGYVEGTGTAALFASPFNLTTDANGNIYVSDANNHRIRKITPEGVTSTIAGSIQGDTAKFNYPSDVAIDAAGVLYVADTYNHKIKKISPTGEVSTFAGSTSGYLDATGTDAKFQYPTALTLGTDGSVYVADKDNQRIRKISPDGVVTTMAGNGQYKWADGNGDAASFASPYDVAVDADGNVYVADAGNHRIRKITPDKEVTTIAGDGNQGDVIGAGNAAEFYYPYAIAIDGDGLLYIVDTYNHKIKTITADGVVSTLAGSTGGFLDGDPTTAKFNYPTGISVAPDGTVYVADKDNNRVRSIFAD